MNKFLTLVLAFALAFTPLAFAGNVDVSDDSTQQGRARELSFGSGLTATVANGVASVSAAAAAITSGTISGVTTIAATVCVTSPMLKINGVATSARPASGATAGTIIAINNANDASDCGVVGGGSTFVVCVSDGTNWKTL